MRKFLSVLFIPLFSVLTMSILIGDDISRAMTITPTPTINYEETCLFPCWNHIIPNQTSWLEAQQTLEDLGFHILPPYVDPSTQLTVYTVGVNVLDRQALENESQADKSSSLRAKIFIDKDVVYSIQLQFTSIGSYLTESDTNRQTWEIIEPSQILRVYYPPDYVEVGENFIDAGISVNVKLVWESRGILLRYGFLPVRKEGDLCWNVNDIDSAYLYFYAPNNADTFQENIQNDFRIELTGESDFGLVSNAQTEEVFLDLMKNKNCMSIRLQPETPVNEFSFDFGW